MQRFCEMNGIKEVSDLERGMDFRLPQYRREVFLRFYEFHTKYKAHPGAVYYAMPYIFEKFNLNMEQKLWICFINGMSQNIVTTKRIFEIFPDIKSINMDELSEYFRGNYLKFGWDVDRRYVKNKFESAVENYFHLLNGRSQEEFFASICSSTDKYKNFDTLWDYIMSRFYLFGRLSTFSYMEYLKIAGLNIECSSLILRDLDGSKSHRNGLCKVLGRDDLDWYDKENPNFTGYTEDELTWLEKEAILLLRDAKDRIGDEASYFTLESTLCCFKSWHRINRRYPNVYNDMFIQRIERDERLWGERNEFFREMRRNCLPERLRVEDNPNDPGLVPIKQNHYRLTGEVIMMDLDWDCFKNNFNKTI